MWRCGVCETNNGDGDKFCAVCGSPREVYGQETYQPIPKTQETDNDCYVAQDVSVDDNQSAPYIDEYVPDAPYDREARYDGSYATGGTVVRHRRKWPWLIAVLAVLVIAAGSGVLILENIYGNARDAMASGEYETAYWKFSDIAWYRDSREQAAGCEKAMHIAAGDALLEQHDFVGARAEYELADSEEGRKAIVESWFSQSDYLTLNGDYAGALAALENVADTDTGALEIQRVHIANARAQLEAGDISAARAAAEPIADTAEGCEIIAETYIIEGDAFLAADDTSAAVEAYTEALGYANVWENAELAEEINTYIEAAGARGDEIAAERAAAEEAARLEQEELAREQAEQEAMARIEGLYAAAVELAAQGDLPGAIYSYMQTGGYADSRERILALMDELRGDFSAGGLHYLQLDGGVVSAHGNDFYGQCGVDGAVNVIQVAAGRYHSVVLYADGTVYAAGDNSYGQCDVSGWTDIVAVVAGGYHTVGLRADGTVVAVGWDAYGQRGVRSWADVAAISAGDRHTVALLNDGTVVAAGDNSEGQLNVTGWQNVVQISCGYAHTVALRADGTIVAAGWDEYGQLDVESARDAVCVAAGWYHTAWLEVDGSAYACGNNYYGQLDVAETGAAAVDANGAYTLCVDSTGNLVRIGQIYGRLTEGMNSADVRMLQQVLAESGAYSGKVDGAYMAEFAGFVKAHEQTLWAAGELGEDYEPLGTGEASSAYIEYIFSKYDR